MKAPGVPTMRWRGAVAILLAGWVVAHASVASAGSAVSVIVGSAGLRVTARGAVAAGVAGGAFMALGSAHGAIRSEPSFAGPTYLIIDATPPDAEVFLDGRRLGTARELAARARPLAPGWHALEIVAPAFRPYVATVAARPGGFPIRVRAMLVPESGGSGGAR